MNIWSQVCRFCEPCTVLTLFTVAILTLAQWNFISIAAFCPIYWVVTSPFRTIIRLASRVMLGVQRLQALTRDVCVDLGSRQIGVAEQHLHRSQVGTVID